MLLSVLASMHKLATQMVINSMNSQHRTAWTADHQPKVYCQAQQDATGLARNSGMLQQHTCKSGGSCAKGPGMANVNALVPSLAA